MGPSHQQFMMNCTIVEYERMTSVGIPKSRPLQCPTAVVMHPLLLRIAGQAERLLRDSSSCLSPGRKLSLCSGHGAQDVTEDMARDEGLLETLLNALTDSLNEGLQDDPAMGVVDVEKVASRGKPLSPNTPCKGSGPGAPCSHATC